MGGESQTDRQTDRGETWEGNGRERKKRWERERTKWGSRGERVRVRDMGEIEREGGRE